jgi:RNA polymerase sigma factor (sigma-70 family)
MVVSNSGTKIEAEDLFQDIMVVLYENILKQNLNLTSTLSTYLYSISWHLWLQRLNKRKINFEFTEMTELNKIKDVSGLEEIIKESEKYRLFRRHFIKLRPNDQKVLKLHFAKTSSKQAAVIMGFKSDKYAKVRKYICKEKLKNSIINDPLFKTIYPTADRRPPTYSPPTVSTLPAGTIRV